MENIISKINAIISKILPLDKCHHFITGLLLFTVLQLLFSVILSFVLVASVATIKELYDLKNKATHTPDMWDAVATMSGALIGVICAI